MTDFTPDFIAQQRAIIKAATPGPWYAAATDDRMCMNARYVTTKPCAFEHDQANSMDVDCVQEPETVIAVTLLQSPPVATADECDENTVFIAEARTYYPAALDRIEALEEENANLKDLMACVDSYCAGDIAAYCGSGTTGVWREIVDAYNTGEEPPHD